MATREKTEIRESSKVKGKGVFVLQDFTKDEVVMKLEGKEVDYPTQTSIQIGTGKYLESEPNLNHSCSPNVYIDYEDFTLRALRSIRSGEEVTFDYNSTEYDMQAPFKCLCGEENCRKIVKGFKHLSLEEQKNINPLAPYLQRIREK